MTWTTCPLCGARHMVLSVTGHPAVYCTKWRKYKTVPRESE
jgi:hypothetical protein